MTFVPQFALFFWLLCGHAFADYALQPEAMAIGKDPRKSPHAGVPWYYWLAAHSLIHGGIVAWLTGHWLFCGFAEAVAHFFIDWKKSEGKVSIHTDQALHVGFKALWVLIAWRLNQP